MDPAALTSLVSSLGFPAAVCIILFVGFKYMLDNQQKNTDRMFEMYEKSNTENREAIRECTSAINKLCDSIERLPNEK